MEAILHITQRVTSSKSDPELRNALDDLGYHYENTWGKILEVPAAVVEALQPLVARFPELDDETKEKVAYSISRVCWHKLPSTPQLELKVFRQDLSRLQGTTLAYTLGIVGSEATSSAESILLKYKADEDEEVRLAAQEALEILQSSEAR